MWIEKYEEINFRKIAIAISAIECAVGKKPEIICGHLISEPKISAVTCQKKKKKEKGVFVFQ